jgi:deoxyribodipyrimidine photolyase-related protein
MFDPIDAKSISNWSSKNILFRESPYFLSTNTDLNTYKELIGKLVTYSQAHFYKWQRTRLNILIDKDGKPEFNSWSFDNQNRNPFPKNYSEPIVKSYASKYSKFTIDYMLLLVVSQLITLRLKNI